MNRYLNKKIMDHEQVFKGEDPDPKDLSKKPITNEDAVAFENPSTDPGFEPSYLEPPTEEEKAEDEDGDDPHETQTDII